MLSFLQTQELIELVRNSNIDHLIARTGHGLLTNMEETAGAHRTQPYMGLEGHTKSESEEAMQDWNWKAQGSPINKRELLHRHKIGNYNATPAFHESSFKHLTWQIVTIAPLYFEIYKTPTRTIAELQQSLTKPTNILRPDLLQRPFYYEIKNGQVLIRFPFSDYISSGNTNEAMIKLYKTVWKECTKIYYLYCESVNKKDAIEFIPNQPRICINSHD